MAGMTITMMVTTPLLFLHLPAVTLLLQSRPPAVTLPHLAAVTPIYSYTPFAVTPSCSHANINLHFTLDDDDDGGDDDDDDDDDSNNNDDDSNHDGNADNNNNINEVQDDAG